MRASVAIAALASAVSVRAVDHLVKVGANGLLAFDPPTVQAAQGDTVTFEFHPKNHSVIQSTFTDPCTPVANGASSGFLAVDPAATQFSQWQITVENASAPLWFHCGQVTPKPHCGQGMVFAINDTPAKSFAMFQATANATANNSGTGAAPGESSAAGTPAGQTSAAAPPADTAAATSGSDPASAASVPGTNVGATGAASGPIAGATSGSIPAGAVPTPATGLPVSSGAGTAAGAAASAGASGAPSGALPRVSSGFTLSSTLALAGVVALLLQMKEFGVRQLLTTRTAY